MQCPIDQADLIMSERQGIEIDYCPKCRGVWLDRGELDKIIERTSTQPSAAHTEQLSAPARQTSSYQHPHKSKKKESFLSDLFDFGD